MRKGNGQPDWMSGIRDAGLLGGLPDDDVGGPSMMLARVDMCGHSTACSLSGDIAVEKRRTPHP